MGKRTISLFDEGGPPPCPARFNLAAHALSAGPPDKLALTIARAADDPDPERLTYADLRRETLRAAGGLRSLGVAPGDRVMLRIGHSKSFPILFLACAALGAVPVPTSTMLSAAEADFIADDTDARLIIRDDDVAHSGGAHSDGARPCIGADDVDADPIDFADTGADDLAYIVYTSGSSGHPKGVAHAHRAAWARRMMWRGWYGLAGDDVMLHAGAFNWTYTLGAGLMDPWAAGASTLIYAGPRDPSVWPALAERYGATIFAAAPGVYRQLLKSDAKFEAFAGIRHGLSAGETMTPKMRDAWTEATGKPIYEALGMTEVSTYLSSSPSAPPKPAFAGRPQDGRRLALLPEDGGVAPVAIGERGLIAVRRDDPGLMLGYWGLPDETAAAMRGEWFVTGDLGVMDEDGYVAFKGRADDLMNALGYRVAPEEVEAALGSHPAVSGAAAVELPVRADLSVIACFFVGEDPAPKETDLRAHCASLLATYKIPKIFRQVDELPRNPNGKLRRRDLIAQYGYKADE